jgi:hypothetical protein
MIITNCQIAEVRFCFSLNKCIAKMTIAERRDYESQIADYLETLQEIIPHAA